MLMSLEANGQSTVDDDGETCGSGLPTSEQVANLIRVGMEKVIASIQQQSKPASVDTKDALVLALECEYGSHFMIFINTSLTFRFITRLIALL